MTWFIIGFFTCAAMDSFSEGKWKLGLLYLFVILVNLIEVRRFKRNQ
jgi:hypothetical protein